MTTAMTNYSYKAGFEFRQKLRDLINKLSLENTSDTPDFILASYLDESLQAFDRAVDARTKWFGPRDSAGPDKEPCVAPAGDDPSASVRTPVRPELGTLVFIRKEPDMCIHVFRCEETGREYGVSDRLLTNRLEEPKSPSGPNTGLDIPSCPADRVEDSFLKSMNRTAHLAYNVYGDSVHWKNYAGLPMPQWEDLPRRIRASWCLTTQAIETEARSDD